MKCGLKIKQDIATLASWEEFFEDSTESPLTLSAIFLLLLEWILISQAKPVEHLPVKEINKC